jgi:uncharacterized protein
MKINIKAFPNAKKNRIEQIDEINYSVSVKEPPMGGRANRAIIEVIAAHFNVATSRVSITSGWTSPKKIIEIKI